MKKKTKRKTNKNKKCKTLNKWLILIIIILSIVIVCLCIYVVNIKKLNNRESATTIVLNDDNYVLLGDSITDWYPIDDFFSETTPIINSGFAGYRTYDVLNNLDQTVYRYNPSAVFIEIGTNDLVDPKPNKEDLYNNIVKIVQNIKKNRPYTKIYIESIYPINKEDNEKIDMYTVDKRNPSDILEINTRLKDYCKTGDAEYIDLYSELSDDNGNLKLDYTVDGVHLSKEGYLVVSNILKKYIEER